MFLLSDSFFKHNKRLGPFLHTSMQIFVRLHTFLCLALNGYDFFNIHLIITSLVLTQAWVHCPSDSVSVVWNKGVTWKEGHVKYLWPSSSEKSHPVTTDVHIFLASGVWCYNAVCWEHKPVTYIEIDIGNHRLIPVSCQQLTFHCVCFIVHLVWDKLQNTDMAYFFPLLLLYRSLHCLLVVTLLPSSLYEREITGTWTIIMDLLSHRQSLIHQDWKPQE